MLCAYITPAVRYDTVWKLSRWVSGFNTNPRLPMNLITHGSCICGVTPRSFGLLPCSTARIQHVDGSAVLLESNMYMTLREAGNTAPS